MSCPTASIAQYVMCSGRHTPGTFRRAQNTHGHVRGLEERLTYARMHPGKKTARSMRNAGPQCLTRGNHVAPARSSSLGALRRAFMSSVPLFCADADAVRSAQLSDGDVVVL